MSDAANAPVIIKRKKVVGGDGHHGGAWKVAYADFVTAMMAFFMLMWLLNATTEQQRKGLADYFSPTLPLNRISSGGDGMFGGTNIFSQEKLAEDGTGGTEFDSLPSDVSDEEDRDALSIAETRSLSEVEAVLIGRGGESLLSDMELQHVVSRISPEGLIIEVYSRPGFPLFEAETGEIQPLLASILAVFAEAFTLVENPVTIRGYTAARPIVLREPRVWDRSITRADHTRRHLQDVGLSPQRIESIEGFGDRKLVDPNGLSPRNDRIEVILVRLFPQKSE